MVGCESLLILGHQRVLGEGGGERGRNLVGLPSVAPHASLSRNTESAAACAREPRGGDKGGVGVSLS